jgi:hypothetical protein
MMASRWISVVSTLLLVCTAACDADPEEDPQGAGTDAANGRFTPPASNDDTNGGSSNDTGASSNQGNGGTTGGNSGGNGSNATPAKPASSDGTCASPRCFGGAGICGCQGGDGAGATVMACIGGKCRCGDKTIDAANACGQKPDEQALRALFAGCGCK